LKSVKLEQKQIVPNERANKESEVAVSKQRGRETLGLITT